MSDCGSEQAPVEAARNLAATEDTRLPLHLAQTAKNPPAMQETRVQSLGREDPLEEMAAHSSILAWRSSWTEATVLGVAKSRTRLGD